ncbi:hypothetical protein CW304_24945 [Bacillus sp. UFRGS-B20]|nr:hypothetical protein CW304_24945 [Bacillus sp. UFRGS-B20]
MPTRRLRFHLHIFLIIFYRKTYWSQSTIQCLLICFFFLVIKALCFSFLLLHLILQHIVLCFSFLEFHTLIFVHFLLLATALTFQIFFGL